MSYPYPIREVLADALIHALGLLGAIVGTAFLMLWVAAQSGTAETVAVAVYLGFLLFALTASAAYHMLPWERPRPWLHKIDHAAIYLKIAGTYTPLVVIMGTAFAYVVLAAIWIVAIFGAVAKLSFWRVDGRGSLALYLAMGWACVLLAGPILYALPVAASWLIGAGGLLYSVGTIFFAARQLPYQNAIWHAFVLSASACFFAAISLSVTTI